MHTLDIDEELDTQVYSSTSRETPTYILGVQIKNNYDNLRCIIPGRYEPRNITHFVYFPETQPLFFKGIILQPNQKMRHLIKDLNYYTDNVLSDVTLNGYNNILKKYNISCSECYHYLKRGVYPINNNYINKLTTNKISISELYSDMFSSADVPFYMSVNYFVFYILNTPSCFKTIKNAYL